MNTGRLFFAGAILLGLAYFALRSPLPAADPRFIKEDFPAGATPVSISVFLETGYERSRAHELLKACADALAIAGREAAPAGVENCAEQLKAGGIHNAMVNYAGALAARGTHGTAPWRIGIRNTRARGPQDVLGYLLEDRAEAVATVGEDDPGGHALNESLRSVTVVAGTAPAAMAVARTLFDGGLAHWSKLARDPASAQVLAVEKDGQIHVTQALAERVKFLHEPQVKTLP